jgi:hypothetical protein
MHFDGASGCASRAILRDASRPMSFQGLKNQSKQLHTNLALELERCLLD